MCTPSIEKRFAVLGIPIMVHDNKLLYTCVHKIYQLSCSHENSNFIAAGYCEEATEKKPQHFADENVCRPYLLGVCLSELFNDTVRIMK